MSTPPTWPPPPPPQMPPGLPGGAPPYYAPEPPPKKSSAVPIVVILIVVVFGGLFVVGIIAGIAIPSLMRARMSGNEAAALGAVRTMESAQVAWASRHGGRFVQPDCLASPPACGDAETSSLLPIDVALLKPHSGYDFGFVLRPGADDAATGEGTPNGASAPGAEGPPGVSPPGAPSDAEVRAQLEQFSTPDTSASPATPAPMPGRWPPAPPDRGGFAYWASPSNPGVTGRRRFCVDETGLFRAYGPNTRWAAPSAEHPRCPEVQREQQ